MRGCILGVNCEGLGWYSTVCSFTIYFVDLDLRIETFFQKDGAQQKMEWGVNFEIGLIGTSAHFYWRLKKISCRACLLSYCFGDKKIAFKISLDLYFHPSIIEFRIQEKIHTKAVVDVSRDAIGRIFLFSWERLEGG